MTVQTTTSRADYTGNGTTTAFSVPFYFLDNTHIQVLRTQISTGVISTLALSSDYTVSGAGVSAGGTVTMAVAPTTDQKLSILRNVPQTQLIHYVPNDPFPAATHEQALDQLTMEVQQVNEVAGRALVLSANTPSGTVSTSLPSPSASKLIGWNATATGLQNLDPTTLATIAAFGTAQADVFTGNGSTTVFGLSANPGALANLDVSIGGVTQLPTTDYTWTGGQTVTFTSAPPNGAKVLIRYLQALPQGVTDASLVSYSAAVSYSTGSIGSSLKTLEQTVSGLSVSSPATGVFFDTAAGDTFTARAQYPTNAALTVTPPKAAFSAATATVSDLKAKQPDGNLLQFCFDNWTIEATYTVTSFPAADAIGFLTGFLANTSTIFGGEVKAHPGSATQFFARIYANNSALVNDVSGVSFTAGDKVVVQLVYSANTLTFNFTYGANPLRTATLTMVLTATSYELPRMFVTPAIRMTTGVFALNSMKVYSKYPSAKFAFVGDSITQGRFCTNFSDGFPQLMRAQFPNGVLVCGAPSAKVGDWITPAYSVISMQPKYAFVMLGTNDVTNSVSLATTQANYLTLIGKFVSAGITPILMTIPPNTNGNTPAFNSWLKSLGYKYIDIYATLYGSGNSMNATYDSGDGIHPNTAGNLAIYNAIMTFIQANAI